MALQSGLHLADLGVTGLIAGVFGVVRSTNNDTLQPFELATDTSIRL